MRILFLTKSKKYTCKALLDLMQNHTIVGVVCKEKKTLQDTEMQAICMQHKIRILDNGQLYQLIKTENMPQIDLVISNTFGKLIHQSLIDYVKGNCINLHGAILPNYKGVMTYNWGLLHGEKEWGVTAHYVNEKFDAGDIIEIVKFPINSEIITVAELEDKTQRKAYELTMKLVDQWEKEGKPKAKQQTGAGRYYSKEEFEVARKIELNDTAEAVQRKIHAFWCPPYEGAYIEIDGKHFQLLPLEKKTFMEKENDEQREI